MSESRTEIKVFKMNNCDWMAGESLDSCKDNYLRNYFHGSIHEEPFEGARQLTEQEMDKFHFCDDEVQPSVTRTFREQLAHIIERGERFPTFFASTEF